MGGYMVTCEVTGECVHVSARWHVCESVSAANVSVRVWLCGAITDTLTRTDEAGALSFPEGQR